MFPLFVIAALCLFCIFILPVMVKFIATIALFLVVCTILYKVVERVMR